MAITVKETPALGFETADLPEMDARERHPPRKMTAMMPAEQAIRAKQRSRWPDVRPMAGDASLLLGCITGVLSAVSVCACRACSHLYISGREPPIDGRDLAAAFRVETMGLWMRVAK